MMAKDVQTPDDWRNRISWRRWDEPPSIGPLPDDEIPGEHMRVVTVETTDSGDVLEFTYWHPHYLPWLVTGTAWLSCDKTDLRFREVRIALPAGIAPPKHGIENQLPSLEELEAEVRQGLVPETVADVIENAVAQEQWPPDKATLTAYERITRGWRRRRPPMYSKEDVLAAARHCGRWARTAARRTDMYEFVAGEMDIPESRARRLVTEARKMGYVTGRDKKLQFHDPVDNT